MRRIFITPNIIELSKDYSKNLFKDRNQGRGRRFSMPIEELNKLESNLRTNLFLNYANYVKRIIDHYGILNSIKPQYFDSLFGNPRFITIVKKMNLPLPKHNWEIFKKVQLKMLDLIIIAFANHILWLLNCLVQKDVRNILFAWLMESYWATIR